MPEIKGSKRHKGRQQKRPADSLKQLIDLVSDGVLLIDATHHIVFANKAAKRLIGQTDLQRKKLESLLILTAHNKEHRINDATIPTPQPLNFHSPTSNQDGTLTLLTSHQHPSFNHLIGSATAIAVLKKLDNLSTATATPTAAYQEILGHLTLRIAHDFNNSLTAILGNAELVQDTLQAISAASNNKNAAEQAEGSLPVMQDFIRKVLEMATFIKKLQDYAKQQPRPKETLDINQTISEIIPIAQRLLGRKINLEFSPADELPQFYGEHAQIDQIIFSLLLNSKENMPAGGLVTIRTEPFELDQDYADNHAGSKTGSYIRLTVADTGSRIPEDALPQTFELFSSSTTHEGGLRLPTVYAIVKQLGGYIDVESWQGGGARFEIFLPRQITQVHSETVSTEQSRRRSRPGPKIRKSLRKAQTRVPLILIAEDHEDIKRSMERAILKAGYEVVSTANGADALIEFESLVRSGRRPSLVISDLGLPGIDGRTLCKKIREAHPRASLLLMTGHRIDLKENNSKTLDDFDFIQKPFESSQLLARIGQILNS
jgi:two-component system cell cycle sensor histidine kinase/response regulator CckA